LNLSISPLRRELLRLEQLGMLRAYDEANVRFYVVNQTSPTFLQLKQAASLPSSPSSETLASVMAKPSEPSPAPVSPAPIAPAAETQPVAAVPVMAQPAVVVAPLAVFRVATPRVAASARRVAHQPWREVLSLVATVVSLVSIFGLIVYFGVPKAAEPRRAPSGARTLQLSPVVPTTVQPQPSTSGEMKSSRWRLMPGSIGGGWSQ
jgi:hypothetical protein